MATVTDKPQVPVQERERIYSPLARLRGTIRRYIFLEAAAVFVNVIAIWFWLGLIFDFGVFKLAGLDWAQQTSKWVRLALQILIGFGVLGVTTWRLFSLFRTYRPAALALLLERRFPKKLGDRLITAVELADNLDEAETLGYSRAMIVETVRKVSFDVEQVPIREVFRWSRLRNYWIAAAFNVVGVFLIIMAVWLARNQTLSVVGFGYRFADISQIFVERNFLLMDTLWPRRAHLEILDFPESGELRIQQGSPAQIRARALKWVISDHSVSGGWRALTWSELTGVLQREPLPDLPVAALYSTPAGSSLPPPSDSYWTLDRIEALMETADARDRLAKFGNQEFEATWQDILTMMEKSAANPRNSRRLRKLEIPNVVTIDYWGKKSSNEATLTRQQEFNEFTCSLKDLKESVRFYLSGEDFRTYPDRRITLVPPPMFTKLERDEYYPAYLFHRAPADGSLESLKGLKQVRLGVGVSLTGSTSRMEVPMGADIVLRGETDKELSEVRIRYRGAKAGPIDPDTAAAVESLVIGPDRHSLQKRFDRITRPIEFDFELTDSDNVKSLRHIIIQPVDDRSPEVNVAVETIRKTPQGYMCTPLAMIPLTGTVRDDSGLTKVEYLVSYARIESAQVSGMRAAVAMGVLGAISPAPTTPESLTAPLWVQHFVQQSESREGAKTPPPFMLRTFLELAEERDREFRYGKDQLHTRLQTQPPQNALIRQFDVKPNLEWLDLRDQVQDLQLGATDVIRPRFRMRLTVSATDNNIESGPRTGQNKETFTFLVVPHEELMGEMNKDEEALGYKLSEIINRMEDVRADINKVVERMPTMPGDDGFRAVASRAQELEEAVAKGRDLCQEIYTDFNRLFKESQINRLPNSFVEQKDRVVNMLDEGLRTHFPRAEEAHSNFRKILEERRPPEPQEVLVVRQRQDELVFHLKAISEKIGSIIGITRAAQQLVELIKAKEKNDAELKTLLRRKQQIIEDIFGTLELMSEPIKLAKGERRLVTIALVRSQLEGELVVRFDAPKESDLALPSEVLTELKSTQLTFEIKAGEKIGDFSVTIVPLNTDLQPVKMKDGRPFVLKISVK